MRALKHPGHKQDVAIVPKHPGKQGHPLMCPSRAALVLAAGCDHCAQGADDMWDLSLQDLALWTRPALGTAVQRSEALLSQTPLHEREILK